MGVISQLPASVVNRIAAGEVVVRPANAVKELIENSLDAGAQEIVVTLKQGGLELMQVQDNGRGFLKDDLEMACLRFATSKLHEFEDLQRMQTYGFRGEALASISLVSKVTICSRPADQPCAWTAAYSGCQMTSLRAAAGNFGTSVTAEQLFHDAPSRLASLRAHEEAARVEDVVTRYAVHRPDVSFALRGTSAGYRTRGDGNRQAVIAALIGPEAAQNSIELEHSAEGLKYQLTGCLAEPVSTATATDEQKKKFRRKAFFLFINGRSVSSHAIRGGVETLFSERDLICPFVLVSLKLDPSRLDVNAHPTKEEVIFLEEDQIIEDICSYVSLLLPSTTEQQLTQGIPEPPSQKLRVIPFKKVPARPGEITTSSPVHGQVRTDPLERRLDAFANTTITSTSNNLSMSFMNTSEEVEMVQVASQRPDETETEADITIGAVSTQQSSQYEARDLQLQSVENIKKRICAGSSQSLRELFKEHTFVGCVDAERILIQHGTSLYLVEFKKVLEELFYQIIIFGFGNLGCFRLEEPISVAELYSLAFEEVDSDSLLHAVELLSEKAQMLDDYLSLSIQTMPTVEGLEDLCLVTIPSLMCGYLPQLEGLPQLVRDLVEVPWDEDEETCLEAVCRAVARLFTIKKALCDGSLISGLPDSPEWEPLIRDHLLPRIRRRLLPQEQFKEDRIVHRVVDQHAMYSVFERLPSIERMPQVAVNQLVGTGVEFLVMEYRSALKKMSSYLKRMSDLPPDENLRLFER